MGSCPAPIAGRAVAVSRRSRRPPGGRVSRPEPAGRRPLPAGLFGVVRLPGRAFANGVPGILDVRESRGL